MSAAIECDCGDCRTCRRAMGMTPKPTQSVQLSESTLRLLANLDAPQSERIREHRTATPTRKKQPKPKSQSAAPRRRRLSDHCIRGHLLAGDNVIIRQHGKQTRRDCVTCLNEKSEHPMTTAAEHKAAKPTPPATWCTTCGGEIGFVFGAWEGWKPAGRNGECEVCCDRSKYEHKLEQMMSMKPGTRTKADFTKIQRLRRFLLRELRDGRAYAPTAEQHGIGCTYQKFGCRCVECREWKSLDNKARRNREAA